MGANKKTRRDKAWAERQRQIGIEVLAARPPQAPWKHLIEKYGLCRARLVQLRRTAIKAASRT